MLEKWSSARLEDFPLLGIPNVAHSLIPNFKPYLVVSENHWQLGSHHHKRFWIWFRKGHIWKSQANRSPPCDHYNYLSFEPILHNFANPPAELTSNLFIELERSKEASSWLLLGHTTHRSNQHYNTHGEKRWLIYKKFKRQTTIFNSYYQKKSEFIEWS
jgi:hypothetical protein